MVVAPGRLAVPGVSYKTPVGAVTAEESGGTAVSFNPPDLRVDAASVRGWRGENELGSFSSSSDADEPRGTVRPRQELPDRYGYVVTKHGKILTRLESFTDDTAKPKKKTISKLRQSVLNKSGRPSQLPKHGLNGAERKPRKSKPIGVSKTVLRNRPVKTAKPTKVATKTPSKAPKPGKAPLLSSPRAGAKPKHKSPKPGQAEA
ncbi:hypothetical protein GNI_149950 [Gregarina niphandrodes]|uniref:Uncharacterized protein n=1 Tax=Gregarina niphandrodes TaxID=110365 RepID=A0A023AZJ8_GRENI|nr:hypothetical protein GNI_149950 [Gregarina niphandrodes]EZG44243.1 hypothetical protein GNI_149950 [Gregarina niphandrodes]|eukprot:XP_011132748.1 hypothetical protein GNI_149950 [Gregarina niphandrodes]